MVVGGGTNGGNVLCDAGLYRRGAFREAQVYPNYATFGKVNLTRMK